MPAAIAAAMISLGIAAAPAAGLVPDLLPPHTSGEDGSPLPGKPLDLLPNDPFAPLLPDPQDEIDKVLPPASSTSPPATTTQPAEAKPRAATPPAARPAPTKARQPGVADPSLTSADGEGATGAAKRTAGARAHRATQRDRRASRSAITPSRAAATGPITDSDEPPSGPSDFVGRVIDQIPPQYRAALLMLACISMFLAIISLRERRRSLRVEKQALVDSLTRLPNRQAFERRLAREWKRAERYDRPLGMLLLDLDDFKDINDTQGHAAGDAVLREVAAAISGRARGSDMGARLGGDEFVVLCPETSLDGVKALARELEERLHQAAIRMSIGFTEREPNDVRAEDLVARADAAMYRRKQAVRADFERRSRPLIAPQPLAGTAGN